MEQVAKCRTMAPAARAPTTAVSSSRVARRTPARLPKRVSRARRRRALLTRFGSVAGVRRATREELAAMVGANAADAILRHFAACSILVFAILW